MLGVGFQRLNLRRGLRAWRAGGGRREARGNILGKRGCGRGAAGHLQLFGYATPCNLAALQVIGCA